MIFCMEHFARKKTASYPVQKSLKVDIETDADMAFADRAGYDVAQIARDAVKAAFKKLREKIDLKPAS